MKGKIDTPPKIVVMIFTMSFGFSFIYYVILGLLGFSVNFATTAIVAVLAMLSVLGYFKWIGEGE